MAQRSDNLDLAEPAPPVNILLVDDQAANLLALEAILGDLGHNLVRASSGQEALGRLRADEFALVLLDVQMPGQDGFATARLIRELPNRSRTPIIFLTGYDSDRFPVQQAYSLGAVDYLVKPLVPVILRAKVAGFVELYQKTQTVKQQAEQLRQLERREFERRLAEENARLREAERHWRDLAEAVPNLVWTDLPDGRCDYLSSQWGVYTGIPEQELLGMNWLERVIHPDDRARTLACWTAAVHDQGAYDLEYRIRRHDGQYRWFKTRGVPIRDQHNRIVKWFGTCTDIDDQRQAQEALAQSEQRFRQLADAMPQIVWTAGPDGNVDYLNRRWTEFTGLEGSVGNAGWSTILHPDDRPHAGERWAASVRSGEPFEMEIRLLDRRQQAYRWHLFRTVAVRDEAGRVARWYGTATDIDVQKRAGAASHFLAEASAALASVVDYESTLQKVVNLAVPFFADWAAVDLADGEGLRRLAVAHRDAEKLRLAQELMRDYPPNLQAPGGIGAVFRTGKPEIMTELTDDLLVRGARDERHLQIMRALELRSYICVPLSVSGSTLGVITFATAESGRRYSANDLALAGDLAHRAAVAIENTRLYQALKEADRRKDEFLATLAHELRNPLAPIRNSLQILKSPGADPQSGERSRQVLERQVQHLVRLVDDLLDVSRVMRGKIELRKETIDLAGIVARAVETAQPLIDSQRHYLSIDLPAQPLRLQADPVRLAQVIANLLTNAAKYTEAGGRIWLTASVEDDTLRGWRGDTVTGPGSAGASPASALTDPSGHPVTESPPHRVTVQVRDTGIGIPPEQLPRVFELFMQVDHATTKAQGGLGIGLTLVKNLVEMHGGTVEARSDGLGKGSEFIIRLPLLADVSARAYDPRSAEQEGSLAGSMPRRRLMVVDDNRDAADSLALLLQLQGHEVRVAYDGAAALELAPGYRPELVFLDLGMPKMDGYEVARRLRQCPGLESVRLIALTGWGQADDRRRTAAAGFDRHVVKPVDLNALHELVAGRQT